MCKYNFYFKLSSLWYSTEASRLQEIAGNSACFIKLCSQILYICIHIKLVCSDISALVNSPKFSSNYSSQANNSGFPHVSVWCRCDVLSDIKFVKCVGCFTKDCFLFWCTVCSWSPGTNEELVRDWDMKLVCTIPSHVLWQDHRIMCQFHVQETVYKTDQVHFWFGSGIVLLSGTHYMLVCIVHHAVASEIWCSTVLKCYFYLQ